MSLSLPIDDGCVVDNNDSAIEGDAGRCLRLFPNPSNLPPKQILRSSSLAVTAAMCKGKTKSSHQSCASQYIKNGWFFWTKSIIRPGTKEKIYALQRPLFTNKANQPPLKLTFMRRCFILPIRPNWARKICEMDEDSVLGFLTDGGVPGGSLLVKKRTNKALYCVWEGS